jgi:AAA domain, putative AbiEii toxin, Type IV TA system
MRIAEIKLKDVRCYDRVHIDLRPKGGGVTATPQSLVLAGNNGSGKSAILRGIAMGLCDQVSAGALLRELLGDFVRHQPGEEITEAVIEIVVKKEKSPVEYVLETTIKESGNKGFETVEQIVAKKSTPTDSAKKVAVDQFPWHEIFVAAYGAGLRTDGGEEYTQYFATDAVYSLFKYSHTLQSPEAVWRRLRDAERTKGDRDRLDKNVREKLLSILNLNRGNDLKEQSSDVQLGISGVTVTHHWGEQALDALGDGYRALTTLFFDILGWQLLKQNDEYIEGRQTKRAKKGRRPLDWSEISGITIIDEVEKHLHPSLQRFIISKLSNIFPRIQFIITTHSPLCVAGTADVPGIFQIRTTNRDIDDKRVVCHWDSSPHGMTTDQILERVFGVPYVNELAIQQVEEIMRGAESNSTEPIQSYSALKESKLLGIEKLYVEKKSKKLDKDIDILLSKLDEVANKSGKETKS